MRCHANVLGLGQKTDKLRRLTAQVRFLFLIFAFLILSLQGFSTALADDLAEMGLLGDELTLFEDIPSVFGASKYEQKISEAPSSVSIVTAAEIKKYGYRTLADILQSQRSFHVTKDRNYTYAAVRGFGPPGDYNSRILILVDGHRINDNIYQSGSIGHEFILDVDLIDRVEVIRGPSSSLYGTGAFFAVINLVSKRGRDFQGLEFSSAAGSEEALDGRLTYGNRPGGDLEWLVSGTVGDHQGDDWYYEEFDDPTTNQGLAVDLDGESYRNIFLKASVGDLTLSGGYVSRKKAYPTAPWGTVFNYSDSETVDDRAYLDLKYDRSFEPGWNLVGRLFYDYYFYRGKYPYDWADYDAEPSADPEIYTAQDEAEGRWCGGEVQLSRRIGAHQLILGGEYRDNLKQDQFYWDDEDDPTSLALDSHESSKVWAVFVQDEFHLHDNLNLTVGIRHDDYSNFGGTTNPRLALIYNPLEKTAFKLLYGSAFRAPNVYEQYYNDGGQTAKSNPDLGPETIRTYELVVEQYLGENLRAVATGFYYEIEDLINLRLDPSDDLLIFDNLDEAEAVGLELELEGKWESGLAGRISYTYQETENKLTGEILANSPNHLAKLNLIIPLWRDQVFMDIEEQYTSSRMSVASSDKEQCELGGFSVTNLTFFSQNLIKDLELSVSLYNLFDKKYESVGSAEHVQSGIEQDGRTFRVKVSYLF